MSFEIITEDNVEMSLDKKIANMSGLFGTLMENYNFDNKKEKIASIRSTDLKLLVDFCEKCNYQNFTFNKPLWIHEVGYYLEGLKEKVKMFYKEQLTNEGIVVYSKIADYFSVNALEELITLKLYEVFSSQENIKNFFKHEKKFNEKDFEISNEREKFLMEKYEYYINKQIESIDEDEINNLCFKFYK